MTSEIGLKIAYRPSEVAKFLGVSKRTVLRWILAGELRAVRRGAHWRIPLTALRENIDRWESLLLKKSMNAESKRRVDTR